MFHLGSGLYETTFVAPDTRGSYTWQLRFRERGYNFLDGEEGCKTKLVKPIGPKKQEDEQNFFLVGTPYYSACAVILTGTIVLLLFYE
jgi:hypothetical protein